MLGRPPGIFRLRVTHLWAVGDILGPPRDDLETVTVALCVDLPAEEVPWLGEPSGAQHWANATGLARQPIHVWWRSANAPVWNHRIQDPVLLWEAEEGIRGDALTALRDGRGEELRSTSHDARPTADEVRDRLADEMAVSLAAIHSAVQDYGEQRWAPGAHPFSDALWHASKGYLDLFDAQRPSAG